MKKAILSAVLLTVCLTSGLLAGCTAVKVLGSGNLINETFDISDFTKIKVENGFQVEVNESDSFSVVTIVDDNVLEHIDVKKSGDTLILRPKGNRPFRSATLSAKVTMY
ncbi:GIN domain-containing protein [Chloroflexota bacterium]